MIFELIIGIFSTLISLLFIIETFDFPTVAADPIGLAFFPRFISCVLFISGIKLIFSSLKKSNPFVKIKLFLSFWESKYDEEIAIDARRVVFALIFSLIYPFFIQQLGFMIASIIYVFSLMKLYKANYLKSFIYSFIAGIGLHFLFLEILGGYLPEGQLITRFF